MITAHIGSNHSPAFVGSTRHKIKDCQKMQDFRLQFCPIAVAGAKNCGCTDR
jgi:hypothetical protein